MHTKTTFYRAFLASAVAVSAIAASAGRGGAEPIGKTHAVCSLGSAPPVLAPSQAPNWPNNLSGSSKTGTVTVRMTIDAAARVTNTAIEQSSGDFSLDQEARRLVTAAKFVASNDMCATEPGSYAFVVDFMPPA